MTALLFLFMLINFADKVVVGLAAVPLTRDLGLTPEQFGDIGSAFFLLFAVSAIVVGFISNRVKTKHTLLVMAIIWSVVQFPMLGMVSLETLIVCRIILGAGEGPAGPVATHAIYKWFPDSLRGLPTAVIAQGSAFGVIIAVPLLNWIIETYSWHWAFGALGIAGLVWAVLWLIFGREGTLVDPPVSTSGSNERVPYRYLLTCPTILAVCAAGFASYWGLALGLTWFTSYLVAGLGFSQKLGGNLTVLPWVFGALVVLAGGYVSQRLKRKGVSSRVCRGVLPCLAIIAGGCVLPFVGTMPTAGLKIALLVFGSAIGSTIYVVLPMIISELTPPPAARRDAGDHHVGRDLRRRPRPPDHGVDDPERRDAPLPATSRATSFWACCCSPAASSACSSSVPETDRKRLAARAVSAAPLRPVRA
jgi:sugar phosphate permease